MYFQHHRYVPNRSPNFSTNFGDDGSILNKWQQLFEVQDGGDRQLDLSKLCISDVIDMFQIEVTMFSQILVTIDQVVQKWQHIFEIQDGGHRHLELWLRKFFDVTGVF